MSEQIRVLLSEEELDRKIAELGERISKDYEGESVHLICILKGSIFFTCELAKRITVILCAFPVMARQPCPVEKSP